MKATFGGRIKPFSTVRGNMTSVSLTRSAVRAATQASVVPFAMEPRVHPRPDFPPDLPLRRISVDEYHRMIDAAVFDEDDPVEMLEGWLFVKLDKYPWSKDELDAILRESDERSLHCDSRSKPPPYPLWRFSVADYHRMIEGGIFGENDRLELLRGWLVSKMTHSPLHDDTIEDLDELLRSLLPPGWRLRVQSAITTLDSEPEPDLAIVRTQRSGRGVRHPGPESIGLVIEVADSSLRQDRTEKGATYAVAGIVEYWIINLRQKQVEVLTEPSGETESPQFTRTTIFAPGQTMPLRLDGQTMANINVSDLLQRTLAVDAE